MKNITIPLVIIAGATSGEPMSPAAPRPLSWAPPALENPVTLDMGKETSWRSFKLDKTKDYIVKIPFADLLH